MTVQRAPDYHRRESKEMIAKYYRKEQPKTENTPKGEKNLHKIY